MDLNLKQKNALICGATDGIGLATAKELAGLGANVCLFARNEEKLKARVQELDITQNQQHRYLVADFSDSENVRKALLQDKGEFHILINNSGGPAGGALLNESSDKFKEVFDQHLINNQLLAQHVVPFMTKEGYGRIVNVISVSVKQPIAGLGVSNTIRWAVASWAKTLSKELSHTGITVNNVLPGFTQTGRLRVVNKIKADRENKTLEEVEKEIIASIPSGKFAEPAEVGSAIAFLCTPIAASINGINLPVDGGMSAGL
jgi:3-oxoacyl-[acyl-carrier protein] reductase